MKSLSNIAIPVQIFPKVQVEINRYLQTYRHDDLTMIKKVIEHPSMKKIWNAIGGIEEFEKKELIENFLKIVSSVEWEANHLYFSQEKKDLKDKIMALAATLKDLDKKILSLKKNSLVENSEKKDLITGSKKISNALSRITYGLTDKHFSEVLFGPDYINAGNFRKTGAKNSKEIYATRVFFITFKKYFKTSKPTFAGVVAAIMYNEEALEDLTSIRERVKANIKASPL